MIALLMILTFLLSLLMIKAFIKMAPTWGFLDIPNERSMHQKPIPRGGGIAFIGALLLISIFLMGLQYNHLHHYILTYIAIAIVFTCGILDDKKGLRPKYKFIFIALASLLVYENGISIESLGTYLGIRIDLPFYVALPFTIFAIIGFTNALNLLDGLDGLAASVSLVMLGAYTWLGFLYNDELMVMLASLTGGALLAFLLFNWHPAKIFMGDSGSLTLGFIIAVLSIRATDYISPAAVLFIVALPVLDTFIVMTRRIQRGISPFTADKNHMHHILYRRYEDVTFTTIMIVYIQIAFTIIGYQLRNSDDFLSLILFGILFFIFLNLFDQRIKRRKVPKREKISRWRKLLEK